MRNNFSGNVETGSAGATPEQKSQPFPRIIYSRFVWSIGVPLDISATRPKVMTPGAVEGVCVEESGAGPRTCVNSRDHACTGCPGMRQWVQIAAITLAARQPVPLSLSPLLATPRYVSPLTEDAETIVYEMIMAVRYEVARGRARPFVT